MFERLFRKVVPTVEYYYSFFYNLFILLLYFPFLFYFQFFTNLKNRIDKHYIVILLQLLLFFVRLERTYERVLKLINF